MRGVRVFLLVFGVCALAAALALPYLFRRVANFSESLQAEWEVWTRETTAFIAEHEQAECAPEALRRAGACGEGFSCNFRVSVFMNDCLVKARHSPELCREVPKDPNATDRWTAERCAHSDARGICMVVYMDLAQVCAFGVASKRKL